MKGPCRPDPQLSHRELGRWTRAVCFPCSGRPGQAGWSGTLSQTCHSGPRSSPSTACAASCLCCWTPPWGQPPYHFQKLLPRILWIAALSGWWPQSLVFSARWSGGPWPRWKHTNELRQNSRLGDVPLVSWRCPAFPSPPAHQDWALRAASRGWP